MITIYGKPTCSFCIKAKNLAKQYNLNFECVDIEEPANLKTFKEKMPNETKIPQVWWNGKHIGGYKEFAEEVQNTIGGYGEGKL